jgi:hypothetical protein
MGRDGRLIPRLPSTGPPSTPSSSSSCSFYETSHGYLRKLALTVQFFFKLTEAVLAWFTVASLFLSYQLIFQQAIGFAPFAEKEMKLVFLFVYCMLIFVQLLTGAWRASGLAVAPACRCIPMPVGDLIPPPRPTPLSPQAWLAR